MSSFVAGQILTASQLNTEFAAVPPIGAVIMWAGATTSLPSGWIMCDGSSYSTTGTYANLYTAIGYRYGGSAGTFYVPKLNASYLPIGTSTLNADGSRQTTTPSITVTTSNVSSGGHTHTYNFTLNNHASTGHTHSHNAVGTGNHAHTHTGTSDNDTAGSHTHTYFKPNSGANNITFTPATQHTHGFTTGGASVTTHEHTAANHAVTNSDTAHAHTVANSAWTANNDTNHAHTLNASIMVFIIRYA